MMVNWDFEQSELLSRSSKPDKKDSNSEVLWLGDLYTTATYPFLSCIVTSQTRLQLKLWCLQCVLLKTLCNKYKHHLSWYFLDDHFELNYSLLS